MEGMHAVWAWWVTARWLVVQDEKVRPLSKDQKLGNAIFLRLLKQAWADARKQLEVRGQGGSNQCGKHRPALTASSVRVGECSGRWGHGRGAGG